MQYVYLILYCVLIQHLIAKSYKENEKVSIILYKYHYK